MKKLLMIVALATLATTAMAVPPNLQPPITTGGTGNSSSTEVRITANVVQGIAVNEASPIDFGNLARGLHTGIVSQNTAGRITLKGSHNDIINLTLDKIETDLVWTGANGTDQTDSATATKTDIKKVSVYGLGTSPTTVTLGASGEDSKMLTASFSAGSGPTDNLGSKQRLGSYVGYVVVKAVKTN